MPAQHTQIKQNAAIFKSTGFKYGIRVLVLYLFSEIFKSFDLSFIISVRGQQLRAIAFSAMYVLFGLIVWEGATLLAKGIERRFAHKSITTRLVILLSGLMLYGMLASFAFGFCYAAGDILLFNRYEAWDSFASLSYNMNFGIFLFYMMILAFTGIVYYYNAWKEYQLQAERLITENVQAKYDALRNQVDPHFFFNSLSVLTNLVYKSPDLSAEYITQLAKTYRYILDKKFENLVTIQTELNFLDSYLFLIRIRHQDSIRFEECIDEHVKMKGMIPPAALQMLIENAIKHNKFSANEPLTITIRSAGGYLLVSNPLRPKAHPESSSGIGLDNIRSRYQLASGRTIGITEENGTYIVKIPIIAHS